MAAYQAFHIKAGSAIRGGDALTPSATGVRITGGPDAPTVTEGPFAESAEVACGYYVFEAENLDEALALARDIPVAKHGAVEVWPIVEYVAAEQGPWDQLAGTAVEPAANAHAPAHRSGTPASPRTRSSARQRETHQRRRATASAHDGDDGTGARRRGAADRRPIHRGRRGRQRVLPPRRRPTATRRSSRVDDSGDHGRGAATHGHLWAVAIADANLDSVFRREWGPAVAALARWSGDLTVAEDAVQEAFADALRDCRATASSSTQADDREEARIARWTGGAANPPDPEKDSLRWSAKSSRSAGEPEPGARPPTADDVDLCESDTGPAIQWR